jgi:CheY-like chemotaxis protein
VKPRVLLVEDEAAIRRFVAMALEELPVELVEAPSLAAAIDALRGDPFVLVLCDLMLPDGSGLDLLRLLGEPGAPSPQARRVAFSAGVSAARRQQLEAAGVHGVLGKPASLGELLDCVESALAAAGAASEGTDAPPAAGEPAPPAPLAATDPVALYFDGDRALYDTYRAQCCAQFATDARDGDAWCARADWPALRRHAHSLKTVLLTLGEASAGARALVLEQAAAAADAQACRAQWPALGAVLRRLAADG